MSTTMQQGLASLLIRRTEAGRAKALRCIQAWQHAITAVREAESMADCRINLQNEQIQGVQQAMGEIDTANYVLAVHLANQATIKRDAVIATGVKVIQEEISHCDDEQSDATRTIQTAIRERDNAIAEAKRNHSSTIGNIPSDADHGVRFIFSTLLSVAITVIFLVYGNVIVDNLFFRLVLGVFLFPVLWTGITVIFDELIKMRTKTKERSRTAVAEATLQKAAQAAEMRLREQRVVIEKRVSQAEAHKKKVENALQRFKAEFVQHD